MPGLMLSNKRLHLPSFATCNGSTWQVCPLHGSIFAVICMVARFQVSMLGSKGRFKGRILAKYQCSTVSSVTSFSKVAWLGLCLSRSFRILVPHLGSTSTRNRHCKAGTISLAAASFRMFPFQNPGCWNHSCNPRFCNPTRNLPGQSSPEATPHPEPHQREGESKFPQIPDSPNYSFPYSRNLPQHGRVPRITITIGEQTNKQARKRARKAAFLDQRTRQFQ